MDDSWPCSGVTVKTWRIGAALVALGLTWLITDRVLRALLPLNWGGPNIGGGFLILVALVIAATGVVLLVLGGLVLLRSRPRPTRAPVLVPVGLDAALVLILILVSFVLPDDTGTDGRLAGINGQVGISVDADGDLVVALEICAGSVDTVTVVGPNRSGKPNEVFAELTAPVALTASAQITLLGPPRGWTGAPTSLPLETQEFLIVSAGGWQSALSQVEITAADVAELEAAGPSTVQYSAYDPDNARGSQSRRTTRTQFHQIACPDSAESGTKP